MPPQFSDDELDALVREAIDEVAAVTPRDLGRVMKVLGPRVRGRADGRAVNQLVTRELARRAGAAANGRPRCRRGFGRGLGLMLAQQIRAPLAAFTRRDAVRLSVSAAILVAALTAIFSIDIIPAAYHVSVGDIAPSAITAPRTVAFVSAILTKQAQDAAVQAVPPQYDYTTQKGDLAAAKQAAEFDKLVAPVDAAFGAVLSELARKAALAGALPSLSKTAMATLQGLDMASWTTLRDEMRSALVTTQQAEVRDSELDAARLALPEALPPGVPADQRALAGEIIEPLLVANSSYDAAATQAARAQAQQDTQPVTVTVKQGEVVVDQGHTIAPDRHGEDPGPRAGEPAAGPGQARRAGSCSRSWWWRCCSAGSGDTGLSCGTATTRCCSSGSCSSGPCSR